MKKKAAVYRAVNLRLTEEWAEKLAILEAKNIKQIDIFKAGIIAVTKV